MRALVNALLVVAALAAALRIVVALITAIVNAESTVSAVVAFIGIPSLLWVGLVLLRRSKDVRTTWVPLVLLIGSVMAGLVGLVAFVSSRAGGTTMADAQAFAAPMFRAAGLGLCAAALTWGLGLAARVLDSPPDDDRS